MRRRQYCCSCDMARSSWVQIKEAGKYRLVPRGSSEHLAAAQSMQSGLYVIPDIAEYRSPITGEIVRGRAQHRAHMREHDVIERGNEPIRPPKPFKPAGIKDDLRASYEQLRNKRR